MQNSQAVKKGAAFKCLGEKSCKFKSGSQEMVAMIIMSIFSFPETVTYTRLCHLYTCHRIVTTYVVHMHPSSRWEYSNAVDLYTIGHF